MGSHLASKWIKTEILMTDSVIAAHIPKTMTFNEQNLKHMLLSYKIIFIKPIVGGGGYGVIKVMSDGEGYVYQHMHSIHHCSNFHRLYDSLLKAKANRKYLIQQGISLACINNRPVDYRFKVVKEGGSWKVRALVGRWAKPGLCVTNLQRGATLLSGKYAVQKSLPQLCSSKKCKEMRELGFRGTSVLQKRVPDINKLGFDFGLDEKGYIWILEVNTRPQ